MNDAAVELQSMIKKYVATNWDQGDVWHEVPLGAGGMGMDSVSIVMLLLDCESRWSVEFPAEMLESQPLTAGRLLENLQRRKAA